VHHRGVRRISVPRGVIIGKNGRRGSYFNIREKHPYVIKSEFWNVVTLRRVGGLLHVTSSSCDLLRPGQRSSERGSNKPADCGAAIGSGAFSVRCPVEGR